MTGPEQENTLRTRGRKLSHIIEEHDDGYYEIDLLGEFLFFNRAILKMSGYTRAELKAINSNELISPENRAAVGRMFREVYKKGTATRYAEINFKRKDGSTVHVKMTAALVKDAELEPCGYHGFVRDITERRLNEVKQREVQDQLDAMNESLERALADANVKAVEAEIANIELNQIFNTSPDGMWILDLKRNVVRVNDTLSDVLRMEKDQIEGRKCYDILAGYCCQDQDCTVKRIKQKKKPVFNDIELNLQGTLTPYALTATPFYGIEGDLVGVLENFRDITERKLAADTLEKANAELKRLAAIDGLTNIANRRALDDCLEKEWRRLTREKGELSFILCDVDFFKKYNDTYGHQEGDACLQAVAGVLAGAVRRPADFVARYGGEEFAAILPNTDLKGAICVAELIRKAVMDLKVEHRRSDAAPVVTLSLGVACARPENDQVLEVLLTTADQALYDAKTAGRNQVASRMVVAPA